MKKRFKTIVIAVGTAVFFSIFSCREDSDTVLSYAYNGESDLRNFSDANTSLVGQFEAFWTAMNCNYQIWDYEERFGLNWDEVYNKYHKRFEDYDKLYNLENPIPNDTLFSIYEEIMMPLHDGHIELTIKNIHTNGEKKIRPWYRNTQRLELSEIFNELIGPNLDYYLSKKEGDNQIVEHVEKDEEYQYCYFIDNILYLRLSGNIIWPNYESVWTPWFQRLKELYQKRDLKGLIFDLRKCGGGQSVDYKYLLGALQEEKGDTTHRIGWLRTKTGIGRLDYSPLVPFCMPLYHDEHPIIDKEPIIILANTYTSSFAEIICYEAKRMRNARVIGRRTWGGMNTLTPTPDIKGVTYDSKFPYYSLTYSGHVGNDSTSFKIFNPCAAFITEEGEILEGIGIEPDIDVSYDNELKKQGRDSQLERALEFIRTGK